MPDVHLEHILGKTKNIHLVQVFKEVLRTLWGNLCVLSVCPQFKLCKEWYSLCSLSKRRTMFAGFLHYIYLYTYIYNIHIYTHTYSDVPPCNSQIFDLHIPKKQNETPGKKYINFSEPGLKKHHSIWCLLTLYVLVPFSVTFVLSGGSEFVSSSCFFPWFSLQDSYQGSPILL